MEHFIARIPKVKKIVCENIFEFIDLPDQINNHGVIYNRARTYEMSGQKFIAIYEQW